MILKVNFVLLQDLAQNENQFLGDVHGLLYKLNLNQYN